MEARHRLPRSVSTPAAHMTQSKRRGEALSERDCRKSSNSLFKKLQGGASPPSQCTSMKYSLQPHRYVDL